MPQPFPHPPLPWVSVAPNVPYFQTDDGHPWHPIGQNDAISWHELNPLFRRRDVGVVEAYLATLAAHGVTCLRLMLEYAQVRHRYFESAPGRFSPNLIQFWDDLFALAAQHNLRILLTPFDTFWMWRKFHHHPYNAKHGGPLHHPSRMLLSRETRNAIKARLTFAAERWGGSGALFAWDLWNEIHPAHAEDTAEPFLEFIQDLSDHVRAVELRAFGRTHLQTVSLFGPELHLKPHLKMEPAIFRHPALDFATIHIYEHGTIDDPSNTVDAARAMGRIVQQSIAEIQDTRPFLDTEHGPIHSFKDRRETLPEPFDDEYFRHMQWAHLASGGAGGGMRWPNRHPHSLTAGMRRAQQSMARFMPCIDWLRFNRTNISDTLRLLNPAGKPINPNRIARFACATPDQVLLFLLRRDTLQDNGKLNPLAEPVSLALEVPTLTPGPYKVTAWNTTEGTLISNTLQTLAPNRPIQLPPLTTDLALALQAAH